MRFPLLLLALAAPALGADGPFFRVVEEGGKWWLRAPDGRRFYSMGIDCVLPGDWSPKKDSPMYRGGEIRGGEEAWGKFEAARLREWGFNTVGAWSSRTMEKQGIPYVAYIWIGVGEAHRLADVWDPGYARRVGEEAEKQVKSRSPSDPDLIGWFIDNELPWWGDAPWQTGGRTLLDIYLALPAKSPGRRKAEAMKRRGADEFAGEVARQFMRLTAGAIRKRDPNHLILGCRFAHSAPGPVVRAVGEACDAISVNWYVKDGRPDPNHLERMWLDGRKPILITEYSYRATENRTATGNSRGADVTVPRQADRAERYTRYVETLAALPYVVGFHWFQWADQPTLGRFDGEDCNYGLVDHADEPYEPLLAAMRDMNARVEDLHANSRIGMPDGPGRVLPRLPLPVAAAPPGGFHGATWADWSKDPASGATWGDRESGCECRLAQGEGSAVLEFDAGKGWGCGVTLAPHGHMPLDAAGATRAIIVASAPKGVRFQLLVSEDGAAPPGAESYAGCAGADGEQYRSADMEGTGGRREYEVGLADLSLSGGWGNPSGNAWLDSGALSRVEIAVPGGAGKGRIDLFSVRFE